MSQSSQSQQAKLAARRRSMQFQAAQLELNPSDLAQLALPLGETPHRAASQEATRYPIFVLLAVPKPSPEPSRTPSSASPAQIALNGLTGGHSHG